jgi:hypothetical protein
MTGSGSISLAGAELQVSWIFDGSTYVSTTYIDLLDAGSVRITGAFGTLTAGTLPSGVAIVYRNAAGDVVTPSGDTPAQFVSLRVVSGSTPTAAEMLICAYAAAAGVVVEFRSIEEAGNNDMVLYLYRNGQWEEVGRQPSAGEGSHTYRFVVPGLSAGDIVNLMVRDDEGQHHTRNNVTVGRFAAEMLRMDQNVLALQWESLPGRTYDIQRAERLDGAWEPMQSVEAVQTQTVTTISVDPAKPTGFFRIGVRE